MLAGAPERACSACGAPWDRVVDIERPTEQTERVARLAQIQRERTGGAITGGTSSTTFGTPPPARRTLGFEPACLCAAESTPGVVLDPFAGAGTTGVVALRHGREFVGIELNAEYAAMARDRIRDDAPLLNVDAERVQFAAPVPVDGAAS